MNKKKLAGIIAGCTVVVVAAVLLIVFHPWRPSTSSPMYSLVVDVSPSGSGSVSLSPPGGEYQANAEVMLTATAPDGYRFVDWTGDVGTVADVNSASTVVSMTGAFSVTASYRLTTEIRNDRDGVQPI